MNKKAAKPTPVAKNPSSIPLLPFDEDTSAGDCLVRLDGGTVDVRFYTPGGEEPWWEHGLEGDQGGSDICEVLGVLDYRGFTIRESGYYVAKYPDAPAWSVYYWDQAKRTWRLSQDSQGSLANDDCIIAFGSKLELPAPGATKQ